jgi:hypothetical protein
VSLDCFTCPEPDNYAAIALQLQKTALDAEACINPLERTLREAVNKNTIVSVSTNTGAISPNIRSLILVNYSTTFTNNAQNQVSGNAPPAGIYEVGFWCVAIASGAVTDNSFRQLEILTRRVGAASNEPDDSFVATVIYESNTGLGMDMCLNTTVTVNGSQNIFFGFVHNNASNITINTGAIAWRTRISDLAVPRVVT